MAEAPENVDAAVAQCGDKAYSVAAYKSARLQVPDDHGC